MLKVKRFVKLEKCKSFFVNYLVDKFKKFVYNYLVKKYKNKNLKTKRKMEVINYENKI